ncbi:KATNB1-like protein 1 isoform X2 [Dunckerocampus dactyliophorus]|uniref:KATNB1-like protein 1 isoform X2 n=1 Tax=Dunckerocampus dactyliophorus TaxID=161453 RepID=UPI0024062515|nr:KATNB1-like protein 1 isoform X2 [Dunckerocampus dactyliophorus]
MGSSGEDQHLEVTVQHESTQYTVSYSRGEKKADYPKKEEFTKKSTPGRVKRVVSYKRKTRHVTVARKKPSGSGRTHDAANKENKMTTDIQQEMFDMDPRQLTTNVNSDRNTEKTGFEDADFLKLTEPTSDHVTITEVLLGRNLRVKVALTLWQRHFGEMLTYLLRIQDTGVFVDILPLISKSLEDESSSITIGCCVDLFPLVQNVLIRPYEENFQVFNQQLLELWHQEPQLKSFPGAAGELAKAIDSFLSQLT